MDRMNGSDQYISSAHVSLSGNSETLMQFDPQWGVFGVHQDGPLWKGLFDAFETAKLEALQLTAVEGCEHFVFELRPRYSGCAPTPSPSTEFYVSSFLGT